MATVTADDIRILARSEDDDAALGRIGDQVEVAPDGTGLDEVIYTKRQLIEDYGDEITDIDAEVLAAGLSAELTGGQEVPDTDVAPGAGSVEPLD